MLRLFLLLSLVVALGCADEDSVGDVAGLGPAGEGNLSLEWSIHQGQTLIDCLDASAGSIEIVAVSSAEERIETLSCFGGIAESGDLPAASYEVTVRLVDRNENVLDEVALGARNVQSGQTTPLGEIAFRLP